MQKQDRSSIYLPRVRQGATPFRARQIRYGTPARAFTLVELLAVVGVLALLVAIS
ncbi:MAG: prepilin-type N-terminal cleavage/methylation domain-containing protein, partial [Planctomycetota bacterium]